MSRRSNKTRFNVAECINDIVDHIDFNACSYTHITQVQSNFAKIDLRGTPCLSIEEFSKVLRDIADILETSRRSLLNSKRPKDQRARFWCATIRKQILCHMDPKPLAPDYDWFEVSRCEDLLIRTHGDDDHRLREWCWTIDSFTSINPPFDCICRSWGWFLKARLFLRHYLYCIAPKSCLSEAKKALELADMLVDKYGEAMMCRWTVVCNLPRAIVHKGVEIFKDRVKATIDGKPITLDMILEKEGDSYEEKLEHRCRMELYERAVHEKYGDGGVALLHEISRIQDLRSLKRPRVVEGTFLDGWMRFSDDLTWH